MFILVTGGSGSGKSAYAENEVTKLGEGKRIYLATMMSFDEESRRRIARHRRMRADKQFETIERCMGVKNVTLPADSIVLLECMSNLAANEMFSPGGAGERTVEEVLSGIRHLRGQAKHLVVVTNEIFSDGYVYGQETERYQKCLGEINQAMGQMADRVAEVVYGIPLLHKREAE